MSRRRQRIRENFHENFRYYTSHRIPPRGAPPTSTGNPSDSPSVTAARGSISVSAGNSMAELSGGFVHDQPQLRLILRDARGNFWALNVQPNTSDMGPGGVMPHDFPMDPKLLGMLLGEEMAGHAASSSGSTTPFSNPAQANAAANASQTAQAAQQNSPLWVRIPQGQPGQELLETIARLVSPTGTLSQDGLKALLNSPQFQALFQGAQLAQGASQMLSLTMLVGVLIPPSLLAANPELAKALLVAQGLPPGLIQNIPDRAIAGALQALLQTSQNAGQNPLHFLQAVASALTLAGTPVQEVQNLLMQLLDAAKKQGIALPGGNEVTPDMLKALAAKMMASNNPQLLGLNQMVQENFGQGLAQIFSAFIRVFMGGAMMQSQQLWPQAVPNEKMLAELGGLFGALGNKQAQRKDEKRRSKKQARKELRIDDPAFQRVERKEDVDDESQQEGAELAVDAEVEEELVDEAAPSEMGSIFIEVDES